MKIWDADEESEERVGRGEMGHRKGGMVSSIGGYTHI
jgi:hypothetical protein